MTEHLSDGKFAPKEVTGEKETGKKQPRGGLFVKGGPGGPGRKQGVPNKISRDVKEFIAELVADPEVQQAVKDRIARGDTVAFFRALEHFQGKPTERLDVTVSKLDEALLAKRKRAAGG